MRKNIAIYLALFSLLFAGASCSSDDDATAVAGNPYAYVHGFGIGNIKSPFYDYTVEGRDTIVEKVVSGDEFKFVIDQKAKEIYNVDSLTFGTKVDKVVANIYCQGVPYRYDAEAGAFVYFNSTDSIDFTSPVDVRIVSTDGTYSNYYKIKLNVHRVNPDLMVWERFPADELGEFVPARILEKNNSLYLFGCDAEGNALVAVGATEGTPSWAVNALSLPAACDLSSVQLFGDKFYLLASGDLYASDDAVVWDAVSTGKNYVSLFALSDNATKIWAADAENIYYSVDGAEFVLSGSLPNGFPLYGCSYVNTTLSTNSNIHRTILVGYADGEKTGGLRIWSRLSNGDGWYEYEIEGNKFVCPSLENLAVLGYDNALYAFGGAGTQGDEAVEPFSKFFVSYDNGVVWKPSANYAVALPKELKGCAEPFAATVSQEQYMWIVTPAAVWKGRINRLAFK